VESIPDAVLGNTLAETAYQVSPTSDSAKIALCPIGSRSEPTIQVAEAAVIADEGQNNNRQLGITLAGSDQMVPVAVVDDAAIASAFMNPPTEDCDDRVQALRRRRLAAALGLSDDVSRAEVARRLGELSTAAQLSPALATTHADDAKSAVTRLREQYQSASTAGAAVAAKKWSDLTDALRQALRDMNDRRRATAGRAAPETDERKGGGAARTLFKADNVDTNPNRSQIEEWAAAHNFNVSDILGGSIAPDDFPTESINELRDWLADHNVSIPDGESVSDAIEHAHLSDLPTAGPADVAAWLSEHNLNLSTDDQGDWDSRLPLIPDYQQTLEAFKNASSKLTSVLQLTGILRSVVALDRVAQQYGDCVTTSGAMAPAKCAGKPPVFSATPGPPTQPSRRHDHHAPPGPPHLSSVAPSHPAPHTTAAVSDGDDADHRGAPESVRSVVVVGAVVCVVGGAAAIFVVVKRHGNTSQRGRRRGQALAAANELAQVSDGSSESGSDASHARTACDAEPPVSAVGQPPVDDEFGDLTEV
jgi:hypothetical protein